MKKLKKCLFYYRCVLLLNASDSDVKRKMLCVY
jgi:hypothetical protein